MTHALAQVLVGTTIIAAYLIHRSLRKITEALRSTSISTFQIAQALSMSAPAHPPAEWGLVEEGDQIGITFPDGTVGAYIIKTVHDNNSVTVALPIPRQEAA